MDMYLPERHKLRIALKILKTRYRKIKRRERRKECKLLNDSMSLEESDEEVKPSKSKAIERTLTKTSSDKIKRQGSHSTSEI